MLIGSLPASSQSGLVSVSEASRVPRELCDGADPGRTRAQVDPAAFEISGHIIFKRAEDYDTASQAGVWRLLAHASLSEAEFLATARLALDF